MGSRSWAPLIPSHPTPPLPHSPLSLSTSYPGPPFFPIIPRSPPLKLDVLVVGITGVMMMSLAPLSRAMDSPSPSFTPTCGETTDGGGAFASCASGRVYDATKAAATTPNDANCCKAAPFVASCGVITSGGGAFADASCNSGRVYDATKAAATTPNDANCCKDGKLVIDISVRTFQVLTATGSQHTLQKSPVTDGVYSNWVVAYVGGAAAAGSKKVNTADCNTETDSTRKTFCDMCAANPDKADFVKALRAAAASTYDTDAKAEGAFNAYCPVALPEGLTLDPDNGNLVGTVPPTIQASCPDGNSAGCSNKLTVMLQATDTGHPVKNIQLTITFNALELHYEGDDTASEHRELLYFVGEKRLPRYPTAQHFKEFTVFPADTFAALGLTLDGHTGGITSPDTGVERGLKRTKFIMSFEDLGNVKDATTKGAKFMAPVYITVGASVYPSGDFDRAGSFWKPVVLKQSVQAPVLAPLYCGLGGPSGFEVVPGLSAGMNLNEATGQSNAKR